MNGFWKFFRALIGFSAKEARYSIDIHRDSPLLEMKHEHTLRAISGVLKYMTGLTERQVVLHVRATHEVYYPHDDPNTLHIVLGGRPPGETVPMWGSYAVGVQLHQDPHGERILVGSRADGYGRLVRDSSGNSVAQVVGSTIYCFVPVDEDRLYLSAGNGTYLLQRVLELAWDELLLRYRVPAEPTLLDKESFLTRYERAADNLGTRQQEQLHELDERLARLNRELQEVLFARRHLLDRIPQEKAFLCTDGEAASAAWKRLTAHSLFRCVEEAEDGSLLAHTNDVLVEDEAGATRHLGRFVVRLAELYSITVWSEYLTHPRQIPHPHISTAGSVCFGNITMDVNRLLMGHQGIEAVVLVFDWLQEGYDPGLAEAKLEEWPAVGELDPAVVLDLTRIFHRPQTQPPEDSSTKN